VFSMVSDPVARGIVPSLARANANITGVSNFFTRAGLRGLQPA
jgi:ABC-type uncharacterized transport system substrate-binding protein